MPDVKMPVGMIEYMQSLNWGSHHAEWHYVRRFDFWPFVAENHPNPQTREAAGSMVREATELKWKRAQFQEGESGSGFDFLIMHRAMFHILLARFPEALHLLRGWHSPPQDASDPDDLVPQGDAFDANYSDGIAIIETAASHFETDDEFGRFLETNLKPTTQNPTERDPDPRRGVHNYLHNRWSDDNSEVNLGDPRVNIFNRRFWKLHGWIDCQWWRYREAKGLPDDDPNYRSALEHHIHMMAGHHRHFLAEAGDGGRSLLHAEGFRKFFSIE
jgi:hypothetical protein